MPNKLSSQLTYVSVDLDLHASHLPLDVQDPFGILYISCLFILVSLGSLAAYLVGSL